MDGEPLWQFWLNWGVQLVVALATFGAVAVALFGEAFRGKYFPPVLKLELARETGEQTKLKTPFQTYGNVKHLVQDAQYFHVKVSNSRRWSQATQVDVVLLGVERPDAHGIFGMVWAGDVPLGWRHQQAPAPRTVGPTAFADLCSVVKGGGFRLHPVVAPNNLQVHHSGAVRMILHLQARSNEVDSNFLAVEVDWDGKWSDSKSEMVNHIKVREAVGTTA